MNKENRSRRQGFFDLGLLLALALALLAAGPFLARPGLPRDTDAELHVFRAAEMSACWEAGVVYPRWAPDFYYGYGYPIFNYYAPLTYHLSSLFALAPGVDIVAGVKAVFVLGATLGSLGTYLLVRDLLDAEAGVVAAAAFDFAPYVLFVDPFVRGDLAEYFAITLLPPALFLMRRVIGRGGRGSLALAAFSVAVMVLTHNLMGVVGLAFLLATFLWQVVIERERSGVGRGALVLGLGLALSAFFWVPMLVELDAVQLTVVGAGHFDFRNHFVSLGELLAPSRRVDLGAVAPRHRLNLGLAQWVLALGGIGAIARGARERERALLFFALTSAGLVFLMLPISRFVWEAIPPLAYLQFPWRLLGPAGLTLAVLVGAGTALVPNRWRGSALAAVLMVILVLALPTMFPHPWEPDFGDTSPAGIVAFELEGKALGTTSTGDFLPSIVEADLHPELSLINSYSHNGPVDKVNRTTLPQGANVQIVEHTPVQDRFWVTSEGGFKLRLYTLVFPGWHAYIDGEEVEIEPGLPEGFITLDVPAGDHEILVRFEDTPPRVIGWWVSAGGLLALALTMVLGGASSTKSKGVLRGFSGPSWRWLGGAVAAFVLLKVALVGLCPHWVRHASPPGEARPAQYQQRAVLGGTIELLGYDLPRQRVRSGEELTVVLYWRALEPLTSNYQSFVHVTHPSSISWGQSDAINPGGLPTTRWPVDRYVWDVHEVQLRAGTPPGEYRLEVGLYTLTDGRRLPVVDAEGANTATTVVLEKPVEVLPGPSPALEDLDLDEEVNATYDDQVTLLGYGLSSPPQGRLDPPGFLQLTLFWRAERKRPDDLAVTVAVVDETGEPVAMASGPPAVGRHPTSNWSRGEVVRDPYAFWLDETFSSGTYRVGVVVHRGDQPVVAEGVQEAFLELLRLDVEGDSNEEDG